MVSSMNIGGVEKSLLSLLATLSTEKYDVTILMLEKKGGFLELVPEWVKIEEAEWFSEIGPILIQSPYITAREYINKKQYGQLMSFTISYFAAKYFGNRYIYYKNILRNIPKCKEKYDIAIAYAGPTEIIDAYITHKVDCEQKIGWIHFDVSKIQINRSLYIRLFKKFNPICVVSQEGRDKLIQVFPEIKDKVHIYKNIVSNKLIAQMAREKVELDEKFQGIKIVTVGRLSREKGQDLAIEVLERLKQEGYLVRWYCIGEGGSRAVYEKMIEEKGLQEEFILMGAKTNPYPYLAKADIYVQTSRHEGFCLTLAEAKCLNKPIVSTDFTGAKEQIQHGQTGFVAELSIESLYTYVKGLIDQEAERERLSTNLKKLHKGENHEN